MRGVARQSFVSFFGDMSFCIRHFICIALWWWIEFIVSCGCVSVRFGLMYFFVDVHVAWHDGFSECVVSFFRDRFDASSLFDV